MPVWSESPQQLQGAVSRKSPTTIPQSMARRLSEESIRTEDCDGPLLDYQDAEIHTEPQSEPIYDDSAEVNLDSFLVASEQRRHLIQRLKNEQQQRQSTWIPVRQSTATDAESKPTRTTSDDNKPIVRPSKPLLLPAIELKNVGSCSRDRPSSGSSDARLINGYDIARPPSALHAGDFTEEVKRADIDTPAVWKREAFPQLSTDSFGSSPPLPLHHQRSQAHSHSQFHSPTQAIPINTTQRPTRSRAPSLQSYSSSFIFKAPTSPLVQQANNDDLDFSVNGPTTLNKENRRHTLPPNSLQSLKSLNSGLAQAARQPPSLQREETFPTNKWSHSHRRSLGSYTYQPSFSPPSNFFRTRRPSISSEASPITHATLVGSYEESILRGRMSATPSKPLEFTARIGALGKGDCKYKHPTHVSVSFPAVFYHYGSSNAARTPVDAEPSPYVGQIDLENNLDPPKAKRKEKRQKRREAVFDDSHEPSVSRRISRRQHSVRTSDYGSRSASPAARLPLGGAYRIPQEGHLQILIKNPNKTAVKLFLVPYDLHGMEAGTKTFIRQKCYSAGPIIENPISSKPNSATQSSSDSPRPVNLKAASDTAIDTKSQLAADKPILRYLIHLQICCPSKGRYYLYKTVSVVFANRVPDNKEKLQNEIRLPEPRYSPWKPDSKPSTTAINTTTSRRRSYAHPLDTHSGVMQDISFASPAGRISTEGIPPVPPLPQSFPFNTPIQTPQQTPQRPSTPPSETALSPGSSHPEPTDMDLDSTSPLFPISSRRAMFSGLSTPGTPSPAPPSSSSARAPGPAALGASTLSPVKSVSTRSVSGRSDSLRSSGSGDSSEKDKDRERERERERDSYSKLSLFGRPGTPEPGEGLLARKLKGLGVQRGREGER